MKSIVEAVASHAKVHPDKLCLADGKRELDYRGYWECIYGYAKYLQSKGIAAGDPVVVRNGQNIETLVAGLAIQLLKAIFVPVEKNAAEARLTEIVEAVDAKCYIADKPMELSCLNESLKEVLNYRDADADFETFVFPELEEVAEILFTTGTTGKSKGIELIHKNVVAVAENVIDGVEMKKDNVELIPTPLSHSHGLRRYYANMLNGSSVVILGSIVFFQVVVGCIEKYKVTSMDLVPAALATILKVGEDKLSDYKDQIEYVQLGSAPIPESDKQKLCELLPNSRLYNFYGTTESGCSCILDFNAMPDKKNCIGRPTCHANFVFLDDDGNPIEATEENPGLLACAGDMNMVGYYKSEELNREIMKDGYIRTQDLSYRGEDGLIYMLGRQGDVIITGGNKIAPDEIEDVANQCPLIEDCACVPVDNPILGKEPKLYVVIKKGESFDEGEIYQFLKDRLENYKVPKLIEEINEIPRTYNGKIQRKALL
ncbi:MAG: acyl--CoA ligase [Lachnospiraceae bacterium]|nr:acyl--CoA ligase [Lachnospiraceae bacterium]